MSDKLNSPQPKYMSDVRFTYLLQDKLYANTELPLQYKVD